MLVPITTENHHIYVNLSQSYEAEFAPQTGAVTDKDGVYPLSTPLDDTHSGYLYYHNGLPIGFYIFYTDREKAFFVACELYILPLYRKQGLGFKLCKAIYDQHPGCWHSLQLLTAESSRAFSLRMLKQYGVTFTEDMVEDTRWGTCYRQVFQT